MKAIILSAGQGRRLLPLTQETPKCVLPVGGRPLIVHQVERLLAQGVAPVTVVVGFESDQVERVLAEHFPSEPVETVYNPFHESSDNLVSCWVARHCMDGDFLLLNGDTLFEPDVLTRMLNHRDHPLTLATDTKDGYDDDDMKVHTNAGSLVSVGKGLAPEEADGESIGLMAFRGEAPERFRATIERAVRRDGSGCQWYLSAVDELAESGLVGVCPIDGLRWAEVDTRPDLEWAEELIGVGFLAPQPVAGTNTR